MDRHHEVNAQSDLVSNSATSKNHEMPTKDTFSWNTNDCSSSFQSISSVETLESYEGNCAIDESPNVIVVPFISVDDVISEEVITHIVSTNNKDYNFPNDNQVTQPYPPDCQTIKECSIRIDQLEMNSFQSQNHTQSKDVGDHSEDVNESTLNSIPFCNINEAVTEQNQSVPPPKSSEPIPTYYSDEESEFEGFDEKAINLVAKPSIDSHIDVRIESSKTVTTAATKKPEIIRVNSRVDISDKPPVPESVPQKIPLNSESVTVYHNKTSPIRAQELIIKPTINTHRPVAESETRIPTVNSNRPVVENDTDESNASNSGDKVKSAEPTDAKKKLVDSNLDSKTKRKQSLEQIEVRKMEKLRRKKEYQVIAERIRQWRQAMEKRQRKKARKNKMENKTSNRNENRHYLYSSQRKRKRIHSHSSDSSDTSNSSNTSNSSDSSSDSDTDTTHRSYTSDTDTTYKSYTSDTSQTSHRTDSDTSDSSDSSDRSTTTEERYHFNRHRISPSAISNTSSDSSDDDKFNRKRKLFRRKEIRRKPSNMKSADNSYRLKLKKSDRQRPVEFDRKKKKLVSSFNRSSNNKNKIQKSVRGINNNMRTKCFTKRLDSRLRPSSVRLRKSYISKRQQIEPTSAGNFFVTKISSNDFNDSKRSFI